MPVSGVERLLIPRSVQFRGVRLASETPECRPCPRYEYCCKPTHYCRWSADRNRRRRYHIGQFIDAAIRLHIRTDVCEGSVVPCPDLSNFPLRAVSLLKALKQSKGIPERYWIISRVRIQVDATRQPDGILGQQDPFKRGDPVVSYGCPLSWSLIGFSRAGTTVRTLGPPHLDVEQARIIPDVFIVIRCQKSPPGW